MLYKRKQKIILKHTIFHISLSRFWFHEFEWLYMNFFGFLMLLNVALYGLTSCGLAFTFITFCCLAWPCMVLHGLALPCMAFYDLFWPFLSLYGLVWAFMKFFEKQ